MTITLTNSRLCFVSGQCFFEHDWRRGSGPDAVLWDFSEYRYVFNRLRGGATAVGFDFPWRAKQRSEFWSKFLGGRSLAAVGADAAWDAVTPLRLVPPRPPRIETDDPDERVFYDVYGYPHGVVAAVTIQSPRKRSERIGAWRERTRRLALDRPFSVIDPSGSVERGVNIARAIESVLDTHRATYYGEIKDYYRSPEPISIGAVIQGSGVDPALPIDESLQRTLHAVTAWPKDWKTATLPALQDRCLPVRSLNTAAGDALYAVGRNRTLWRPALFGLPSASNPAQRPHTLSCLAHNLVAGAVQAESLRLFAQAYNTSRKAQSRYDATAVGLVAEQLDRMRRGDGTYRSSSIRNILEDPNTKDATNALLGQAGFAQIP